MFIYESLYCFYCPFTRTIFRNRLYFIKYSYSFTFLSLSFIFFRFRELFVMNLISFYIISKYIFLPSLYICCLLSTLFMVICFNLPFNYLPFNISFLQYLNIINEYYFQYSLDSLVILLDTLISLPKWFKQPIDFDEYTDILATFLEQQPFQRGRLLFDN